MELELADLMADRAQRPRRRGGAAAAAAAHPAGEPGWSWPPTAGDTGLGQPELIPTQVAKERSAHGPYESSRPRLAALGPPLGQQPTSPAQPSTSVIAADLIVAPSDRFSRRRASPYIDALATPSPEQESGPPARRQSRRRRSPRRGRDRGGPGVAADRPDRKKAQAAQRPLERHVGAEHLARPRRIGRLLGGAEGA